MHFLFWFLFWAMPLLAVAFVARVSLGVWRRAKGAIGALTELSDRVGTLFDDAPHRAIADSLSTRHA